MLRNKIDKIVFLQRNKQSYISLLVFSLLQVVRIKKWSVEKINHKNTKVVRRLRNKKKKDFLRKESLINFTSQNYK